MIFTKGFKILFTITIFLSSTLLHAQGNVVSAEGHIPSDAYEWSDSVYNQMSLRERVGQLFVAGALTTNDESNRNNIKHLIEEYKVGGFILSKGNATSHFRLTEYAQSLTKTPLFMTIDGEWGLAMRLTDTPTFPRNLTIGAANDEQLAYEYGVEVGRQCRRMGIHINYAPDIDVNSNPKNPVIGIRSYGDDAESVARLGIAYSRGLLSQGVLPVGKHFPGHGDVESDSHKTLPVNNKSYQELQNEELLPFKRYIDAGMPSVMVGHLVMPALDSKSGLPTSLSPVIVTSLLKEQLGFKGLIVTDALEMKGATAQNAALKALIAGNHILLKPLNVGECVRSIENALKNGTISESLLESAVKKVLTYKYAFVVKGMETLSEKNLVSDLSSHNAERIIYSLFAKATTLLKNNNNIVPMQNIGKKVFTVKCFGSDNTSPFKNRIESYGVKSDTIKSSNRINIIGIYSGRESVANNVKAAFKSGTNILVFFTSPYNMAKYQDIIESADAVIMAYEEHNRAQECAAELIMGGIAAEGKLPVDAFPFKRGDGVATQCTRLGYAPAEAVGMNGDALATIDTIVNEGVAKGAYPGCQVLIAKDGKIVYEKAFGKRAGRDSRDVTLADIYDLASVTKGAVVMPAIIHLNSKGEFDIESRVNQYITVPDTSKVGNITMRQLLFHESGLPSGINPYYLLTDSNSYTGRLYHWKQQSPYTIQIDKQTYANNRAKLRSDLISKSRSNGFDIKISEALWANSAIGDTITNRILNIEPFENKKYRYSDLNFILLQKVVEKISASSLNTLADSLFFAPLGMSRTTFQPLKKFNRWEIMPTENDNFLRKELMCGYPHDETACILGGVSGNAGLFGTAHDLAKLLQMMLNGGTYGGEHFLSDASIDLFTQTTSEKSRRSLGFDKPDMKNEDKSPCSPDAPQEVYGHTGYTGTCFWVDKKNNMIFVFLSNRVYPHRWNTKLMKMNIRPKIQNVMYEAIRLF